MSKEYVNLLEEALKTQHPSQVVPQFETSGDAKFDAVAKVILEKLDSHSHQISKQTELIESQGEQIDEMKEAITLMMRTYFDQIKRFSHNFSRIFEDGKPISHIELQDRTELLTETINSAEPSMFRMGDEETQAIYNRIMPSIREELDRLRKNVREDNKEELGDLAEAFGGIVGGTERDLRKDIQASVKAIQSMATNIQSTVKSESKGIKRSVNPNSRNSYLSQ